MAIKGRTANLGTAQAVERAGRWTALAFFNLGVEVGQALFVLVVTALFTALRTPRQGLAGRQLALYSAGIVGVFWLGERIASFS